MAAEDLDKQAVDIVAQLKNFPVVDRQSYQTVANWVLVLRKAKKFFEDRARPRIDEAHKHWKGLLADLQKDLTPIEAAQKYGDRQLSAWDDEQERLRNLEQVRRDAEKKRKEDEERKQLAELAKKLGDKQLAKEIREAPSEAPPVFVQKDVPKVEGLSYREDWKFVIEKPSEIPTKYHRITAKANKDNEIEYKCNCIEDIGFEVRRLKNTADIPGVRVYPKKVPIGR